MLQLLTEWAETSAAIEHIESIFEAHLDARRVAPVAQVLRLGCGCGSPHTPKLDSHKSHSDGLCQNSHLPTRGLIRQFIRWFPFHQAVEVVFCAEEA